MGNIIRLADRGGGLDLPEMIQVACFRLSRVKGRPIYVRALQEKVVICVALQDHGRGWAGFVTARFGTEIPTQVSEVGMLCQASADTLEGCADALGEIIAIGMRQSDPSTEGKKALARIEGGDLY